MTTEVIPFFSIGITTYNRKDMLRQLLMSILEQEFHDYEIIVGNDYQPEPLTQEMIGVNDNRIRIINYEKNHGELENMNALLHASRGRYFTWQFDDDLCAPGFFQECADALARFDLPKCVLTSFSFIYGTSEKKINRLPKTDAELMTGRQCLRKYLSGALSLCSLAGFFDAQYLKQIGGAKRLSTGHMALYAEYYLMIEVGMLPEVLYIKSPLTLNRIHGSSFSSSASALELHKQAGVNLIRQSILLLKQPQLRTDFRDNLSSLLKSVICTVIVKSAQQKDKTYISKDELNEYIGVLKMELDSIDDDDLKQQGTVALASAMSGLPFYKIKARIKAMIPAEKLRFARFILSFISPYTNKSF